MFLCFGTYINILIKCARDDVTNREMIHTVVGTIDPNNKYNEEKNDPAISRLINCKTSFPRVALSERGKKSSDTITTIMKRVRDVKPMELDKKFVEVEKLIDPAKDGDLLSALCRLVREDSMLNGMADTGLNLRKTFEQCLGGTPDNVGVMSKRHGLRKFLSRLFLYTLYTNKNNTLPQKRWPFKNAETWRDYVENRRGDDDNSTSVHTIAPIKIYITDTRKSRYLLSEYRPDEEFEFYPDKFYVMTYYFITFSHNGEYYVLLDHGSYPGEKGNVSGVKHRDDFWSIPRSVSFIEGVRIKKVDEIQSHYARELEKSSMREKLAILETDFLYNYGIFYKSLDYGESHIEYKRSVTETDKMRCYYIRDVIVHKIDDVGIRNLVDPECRHNRIFLPLRNLESMPHIPGNYIGEAPEKGWYSFMGRPIPESIVDTLIRDRVKLMRNAVKISNEDLVKHEYGILFTVAISKSSEIFNSAKNRGLIDRQISEVFERMAFQHGIIHYMINGYQVTGAIPCVEGEIVDFSNLLNDMYDRLLKVIGENKLLLRCTVLSGEYDYGKISILCSRVPGFAGESYENLRIMAKQTHEVQMGMVYSMNGILFGCSTNDSSVKFYSGQDIDLGMNVMSNMKYLFDLKG